MISHNDIEMADVISHTKHEKPMMPSDCDNSEPALKSTLEPQIMTVNKPKHSAFNPFYSCKHPGQFDLVSDRSRKQVWLYRLKLLLGLVFPFFLSSLDTTIIATALPHIASEFNWLSHQSWIVNTYTLPATAFLPPMGLMAHLFGRHSTLQASIFLFLIGSILCTFAPNIPVLLVGRILSGMSSAGFDVLVTVILSDRVNLRDNSTQNTLFGLVAGLAFGVGPNVGGIIVENKGWRWCFGINLPVCVAGHVFAFFLLRTELVGPSPINIIDPTTGRSMSIPSTKRWTTKLLVIDCYGLVLFLAAVITFLIALDCGAHSYSWKHHLTITLLVVSIVCLILFIGFEAGLEQNGWLTRRFPDSHVARMTPMMPINLFYSKDFRILSLLNFTGGIAMFSMFYFISLYFLLVQNYEPARAGLQLIFYLPGLGVGVYLAMFMLNIWPRQTFPPIFIGQMFKTVFFGLLTMALKLRSEPFIYVCMVCAGLGSGLNAMPIPLHGIARRRGQLAQVIGTLEFFFPFGGTVGIGIMSSVLNSRLSSGFRREFGETQPTNQTNIGTSDSPNTLRDITDLPPEIQDIVNRVVKDALVVSFQAILPLIACGSFAALFLGNVWIRGKRRKTPSSSPATSTSVGSSAPRMPSWSELSILRKLLRIVNILIPVESIYYFIALQRFKSSSSSSAEASVEASARAREQKEAQKREDERQDDEQQKLIDMANDEGERGGRRKEVNRPALVRYWQEGFLGAEDLTRRWREGRTEATEPV